MKNRVIAAALLGVAIAASAGAQDQVPQPRQGFGISFGFGGGSAAMSCSICTSERDNGFSGYLRMGGYVSPALFVGGESNGWVKNDMGVDEQIGMLNAVVQWYPQVSSGLYLKGGGGFTYASATDGLTDLSTSGLAATLGAGYDWRLTQSFSLTPYVNYLRSIGGEADVNGIGTGYKLNVDVLQVGLGFTWY